ncbi:AAR2 family protein [Cryptosporidium serpentis]
MNIGDIHRELDLQEYFSPEYLNNLVASDSYTKLVEKLGNNACSLLLLNCDEGMEVGIDKMSYKIGPKFQGIKNIPPGVHFIYYSVMECVSSIPEHDFDHSIQGFFVNFAPGEVVIRHWLPQNRRFEKLDALEDAYISAVRRGEFFVSFVPYLLESYGKWNELVNFITPEILVKLTFATEDIRSFYEDTKMGQISLQDLRLKRNIDNISMGDDQVLDSKHIKSEISAFEKCKEVTASNVLDPSSTLVVDKSTNFDDCLDMNAGSGTIYYSTIPSINSLSKKLGLVHTEYIAALSYDPSPILEAMVSLEYEGNLMLILGEIQFTFVIFMYCSCISAYEQYNKLIELLSNCESMVIKYPDLYVNFLKIICCHLRIMPDDILSNPISQISIDIQVLVNLYRITQVDLDQMKQQNLERSKLQKLTTLLKYSNQMNELVKFKFFIDIDTLELISEDAPIVVSLPIS